MHTGEGQYYGSGNFYNCVLIGPASYVDDCSFENCICINWNSAMPAGTFNCLHTGSSSNIFAGVPNKTNKVVSSLDDIFLTYKTVGSIASNDDESFELTEEAKAKYLGIDGTQVGIYGGAIPYNTSPAIPKITKCNVAAKSTVDGKLSVDIEVLAE